VRIFIASSDKTLRLALLLLLESEPGMDVIGMADRQENLLTAVGASQPEVLLCDYELAKQETASLISDVRHLDYRPKIIVLSLDPGVRAAITTAGADAFIGKNAAPDALLPLLREFRFSYYQPGKDQASG
jgi:SARP family transcriptional regulator, regulator of embCAB operon